MAAPTLYYAPQFRTSSLNTPGGITISQTTGITLASIPADLDITKPGVLCLEYANPLITASAEFIYYTSIDGSNVLQGVTRGQEGYAAKAHNDQVVVAWIVSKSHINLINDLLTAVTAGAALKSPQITTSIDDSSGNEIIKTPATASAVNELTITNAATGNAVQLSATGGDTNIDLKLVPKGTGALTVPAGTYEANVTDDDDIPNKKYVDDNAANGWISANETWAYASASTFTVSGDVTSKYQKGDRIKFTQTTVKYGVIISVVYAAGTTTITIAVNTDYTIANAAITLNYYSHQANPMGYPEYFLVTSASSFGSVARLSVVGKTATVKGWGYVTVSGVATGETGVNLGITFAEKPQIIGCMLGVAQATVTDIGSFAYGPNNLALQESFCFMNISTTASFFQMKASGTFPATAHLGYSWIAIGTI